MDAFYASVELLRYPQLRGQAVVIGGRSVPRPQCADNGEWTYARLRDYKGRGVITTATYEARAKGVGSAMGIMKAAQLIPDAVLLPVDFDTYRHYSRLFKAAVASIAPVIEDRGIDEIYIDLSDIEADSADIARTIKQAVHDATGLICSIGVTPNKLLSKICSDLEKPDGLTLLSFEDIPTRIWPLAVRKINGIGPKAEQKLLSLGVKTIGELAAAEPEWLQTHFGRNYGEWLFNAARGIDERDVVTHSEPKSVSRETTFERDLHAQEDKALLSEIFNRLCEQVAADLVRKKVTGRTIGIKIRYEDFSTVTRDITLTTPTTNFANIRRAAGECLKRVPLKLRLRLLGVRIGHLERADATTPQTHLTFEQGALAF
jgi:DNA polymerase-4